MRLARRAVDEEALVVGIGVEEARAEGLVDLVGRLGDARADRGGDPLAPAPSRSIAAMVASVTPASAPRQPAWAAPIDAGLGIGEQHRRAIGGEDAEQQVRAGR